MDDDARTIRMKSATGRYWQCADWHDRAHAKDTIETYIGKPVLDGKSLLAAELDWARAHGGLPDPQPAATLVLLVGHSFEPLLQTVCAYRPQAILLVLSDHYFAKHDGAEIGEDLREAIQQLVNYGLLDAVPAVLPAAPAAPDLIVDDNPTAVFSGLVRALHAVPKVLLDITGGKKSMVAGAFLYASYANAPITYVDFKEYDANSRRPYGYTCKIDEIANPYQQFSLRDWERIRTLYRACRFQEARALLAGGVADATKNHLPDAAQPVTTLTEVLTCYAAWENGDFARAAAAADAVCLAGHAAFSPPTAVTALGPHWAEGSPQGLYVDMACLPIYIEDELARIRRALRCNHDYRTGFLRAGSLNEIIMLARLLRMARPADQQRLLKALHKKTPSAASVFRNLAEKPLHGSISIGPTKGGYDIVFPGAPQVSVRVTSSLTPWWPELPVYGARGWEAFIDDRNDLTHKYGAVTADKAEAAYAFVAANAMKFFTLAGAAPTVTTRVPSWPQLCQAVGLAPWLPPNLVEGEETPCDEPVPAGR